MDKDKLELSKITEESRSNYSDSTKKDSKTEEMANMSLASVLSCGLEKTTTEVFHPLGERQSKLKERIKFLINDYISLKDLVVDDCICVEEMEPKCR